MHFSTFVCFSIILFQTSVPFSTNYRTTIRLRFQTFSEIVYSCLPDPHFYMQSKILLHLSSFELQHEFSHSNDFPNIQELNFHAEWKWSTQDGAWAWCPSRQRLNANGITTWCASARPQRQQRQSSPSMVPQHLVQCQRPSRPNGIFQ